MTKLIFFTASFSFFALVSENSISLATVLPLKASITAASIYATRIIPPIITPTVSPTTAYHNNSIIFSNKILAPTPTATEPAIYPSLSIQFIELLRQYE